MSRQQILFRIEAVVIGALIGFSTAVALWGWVS